MFPRRTTVTSHGKNYEYIHLVQSERRESDGRPIHRVIANLGPMDEVLFENLRLAFEAASRGRRVAVVTRTRVPVRGPKPQASLRYLDVAVAHELWREWGLDRVMGELMKSGKGEVEGSLVVEALVAQRLLDPDSKLAAVRWFPRTALPELLGIQAGRFNNTRVHRVLGDLEAMTLPLMARLLRMYRERDGAFATMFLDVTDTRFVGHGPATAVRAKTKEGMIRRKIGIVLLCNERGNCSPHDNSR
jgi:hypothetical protein